MYNFHDHLKIVLLHDILHIRSTICTESREIDRERELQIVRYTIDTNYNTCMLTNFVRIVLEIKKLITSFTCTQKKLQFCIQNWGYCFNSETLPVTTWHIAWKIESYVTIHVHVVKYKLLHWQCTRAMATIWERLTNVHVL